MCFPLLCRHLNTTTLLKLRNRPDKFRNSQWSSGHSGYRDTSLRRVYSAYVEGVASKETPIGDTIGQHARKYGSGYCGVEEDSMAMVCMNDVKLDVDASGGIGASL